MTEESPPAGEKSEIRSIASYTLIVLALLTIGVLSIVYLASTKPSPSGETSEELGRLVRVFEAHKVSHRIAISAYGTTRASEVWTAIAEVRGRAVEVSPQFEPGEILPAELPLVKIDRTDYELAERRLKAEVRAKDKALEELNQNEVNLREIYKLQERQLKLAQFEYQRQQEVFAKNAASRSDLEKAENAYIQARTAALETFNQLRLVPVQRELAEASRDSTSAQLDQALRDLSKCEIRLPMAARCASKSIEENQYVKEGERLGTFLALDTTEVLAMVETRKMGTLFSGEFRQLGPLDLTQSNQVRTILQRLKIPAEIRWGLGDRRPVWHGRVTRVGSSLDPGTQTVPVIVEVRDPYKNVELGVRPPLVPDVFCEVTLFGDTIDGVVLVPREALRDGRVYLFDQGKLHIRPVTVAALEEDVAVVSGGIESGEKVILTDLFPASEGMLLRAEVVENPAKPRGEGTLPEVPPLQDALQTTEDAA